MASGQATTRSIVPHLMTTVMQLKPAELREFTRRFADWQRKNGATAEKDAALVQTCKVHLSVTDERRLKKLIGKSERGVLRPNELEEYRSLVRRAEELDSTRLKALVQLARLWDKPVRDVMELIGWERRDDETTGHPARSSEAGA